MTKYKYSRKLLAKAYGGYDYEKDFLEDLLATKTEKELWNKNCPYGNVDCPQCKPTPSPLDEIEEVEEVDLPLTDAVENKINQLIRNQNKIISYLKKK